ncbi:autoinducer binding domain-containing protein, partial [Burkholderia ubonensis]|uniref:autoinducer binding domain-containing protein n=1 Tax=Burkholderia ubonensis TaxID=101571 RepID=UPI000A55618B
MQRQLDDALMLITDLSGCNSDSETLSRLKKVFSILGIPSFLFVTFQLDDEARASDYRFLVGCNPEWIQIYQHRHWYSNDPYRRCCINQSRHGDVYAQRSGVKPLLTI